MELSGAWGMYPPSGSYNTTGCFKLDHGIGDLNYTAQLTINDKEIKLELGDGIIIPAHSRHFFTANEQFKMISTVIKSGYED